MANVTQGGRGTGAAGTRPGTTAALRRNVFTAATAVVLLLSLAACKQEHAPPHAQQQSADELLPSPLPGSQQEPGAGQQRRQAAAPPQDQGFATQTAIPGANISGGHSVGGSTMLGHALPPKPDVGAARPGDATSTDTNAGTIGPAIPPKPGTDAARPGDAHAAGTNAGTIGPAIPPKPGTDAARPGDDHAAGTNAGTIGPAIPPSDSGTDAPAAPRTAGGKVAYLTFDDGPSASTERLLAILRRYGVKATFFVVGTTSEEGKALYRAIAADGHVLGNHTFSHDYRTVYRSPEAFRQDVDKLNALLEETTGRKPDILRYPGGSNNKQGRKYGGAAIMSRVIRDMRAQGYQYFDWSVSSTDAAAPVQERDVIIGSVLSASRGLHSAIVLMHDNARKTTTLEALPTVIEGLRKQGFAFDVLRRSTEAVHFLEPD